MEYVTKLMHLFYSFRTKIRTHAALIGFAVIFAISPSLSQATVIYSKIRYQFTDNQFTIDIYGGNFHSLHIAGVPESAHRQVVMNLPGGWKADDLALTWTAPNNENVPSPGQFKLTLDQAWSRTSNLTSGNIFYDLAEDPQHFYATVVPEPGAYILLLTGFGVMSFVVRRRSAG